jgi:HD-GYP domain-containing protein (c-di-GMP phosphodiesterase class II)
MARAIQKEGLTPGSTEESYLPVEIKHLRPEEESPFRLYILIGKNYVPYAQQGEGFAEATREKLLREGIQTLYVREEDRNALRNYMNQNLQGILDDPSLSQREKSRIVYDTCIYQLERLWVAPEARLIHESKQIFRQTVDHVISANRDAVRDMILMISHETSIYTHSVNVGILGTNLVREIYRNSDKDLHETGYAMFLHDIGKTEIAHRILNKPGPLSRTEWEIMKCHPRKGYEILLREGHLTEEAAITTLQHHERCNGEGYPKGLKSDEIEALGKICNLVDSYDALLANRIYKPALSPYQALKIMKEEMQDHFDQQMFKEFLYMLY